MFRDGNSVAQLGKQELTAPALVEAIVGKDIVSSKPALSRHAPKGGPVLEVRDLSRHPRVKGVSFDLHRGEVLGLGGLVGAGRSELVRLIYGADRADGGAMRLDGQPYSPRTPVDAVARGLGFVPEERRTEGLVLTKSVAFNLSLANLDNIVFGRFLPLLSTRKQNSLAQDMIRRSLGQDARRADTGRTAERRQPAEGGHRPLAAEAAPRSYPRRADARRRYRRARRNPPADPRAGAERAWRCSSSRRSPTNCRTCATACSSWPRAGSCANWPEPICPAHAIVEASYDKLEALIEGSTT